MYGTLAANVKSVLIGRITTKTQTDWFLLLIQLTIWDLKNVLRNSYRFLMKRHSKVCLCWYSLIS